MTTGIEDKEHAAHSDGTDAVGDWRESHTGPRDLEVSKAMN